VAEFAPRGGFLEEEETMATTKAKAPQEDQRLSDEQVGEVLELMKGADSVELKLSVPADNQRAAIYALGLDPLDAQIRQVFFFDTPDLTLNRQGVVVRARRIQGKGGDSVVKLRPIVPDDMPSALRKSPAFTVEVDAMPGGFVCSGSLKSKADPTTVRQVAAGNESVRTLFSKEQRAFFGAHAPEGLKLETLSTLGPIFVLKVNFVPEGLGRKLVAELWLYPDGSRVLELSTKCATNEAFQVAAEGRAFLANRGIEVTSAQGTKTKTALEFFSNELGGA